LGVKNETNEIGETGEILFSVPAGLAFGIQ
jgi:hypothetical protein